ncbi:hypothetical protein TNCV_3557561 [Trichonephila clavipes]|uniref:Uncharacterized protein n=1 Tax=Trichonephila clavipes TaxID=2585209 RepID=A0A8X6WC90_TRICX|nr:hypothetical protein TNCV_3557561 [Trichonephila clavipes]
MPGCRQRRHFQQTDDFTWGMVIGLRREGWSFRQIVELIPTEICPRCIVCGEDGWRREMWHVRGVQAQPD